MNLFKKQGQADMLLSYGVVGKSDRRARQVYENLYPDRTTRGLLATGNVILNYGQVTWATPELAPPLLTTPPHQLEDVSALDRFNVHRCSTRRVFSGIGLELVTRQATIRYLYHSATAATGSFHAEIVEVEIEVVSPSIVPLGNFAELNRTVTCIVLKANDRRTSSPKPQ
ncbi:uncharacterized protein TNCV_4481741 [Trichonephila clavipes]|nr:uncharacterized protein TNCV_4481741 [Trichonephila clavipes]